jgi:hypothetical protein
MGGVVDSFEVHTHSFIVRIWRERLEPEGQRVTWRGHITHVPSGERRYLRHLDDLAAFIVPYLERMGVHVVERGCIQRWVDRWKQRFVSQK